MAGVILLFLVLLIWVRFDNNYDTVIFIVDMQNSMWEKDMMDKSGLTYTRQSIASEYIHNWVNHNSWYKVWIVLLADKLNYLVPASYDVDAVKNYIWYMANLPLNDNLYYVVWNLDLSDFYNYDKDAYYVVVSDKKSTFDDVKKYLTYNYSVSVWNYCYGWLYTVCLQSFDDMDKMFKLNNKSFDFLWIFVVIILLWFWVL